MNDAEHKHLERIKSMGCVVCRNLGYITLRDSVECEAHHLTIGGRRVDHYHTIPLCHIHHRGGQNDEGSASRHPWKREFEKRYGTELELLEQTNKELEELS